MDINDLKWAAERFPDATLGELFRFVSTPGPQEAYPWIIGQAYHIRTVTHFWTGRLVAVYPQELVIEDAAWIADTGRFADFFSGGPNECEPVNGPVFIGRGSIVDAQGWSIALPRSQK